MEIMTFVKELFKNIIHEPKTITSLKENKYEETRGHIEIDIDNCLFCGSCSRKCLTSAIEVDRVYKTFKVDRLKCIQCGYCTECCPKKCLIMKEEFIKPSEKSFENQYTK